MIHSVFELGDTVAREVMVPRTDMVTIDGEKTLRSAMSLFLRSGFSRIPVVGDGSDDVLGLLYFKDVARRVNADPEAGRAARHRADAPHALRPREQAGRRPAARDAARPEPLRRSSSTSTAARPAWSPSRTSSRRSSARSPTSTTARRPASRTSGTAPSACRRRWTSTTSPTCSTSTIDEDEVDTVGGLIGKAIGRVPIVGSHCEVAGLSLTAERMAGRAPPDRVGHRDRSAVPERDDVRALSGGARSARECHDG